MLLFAKQRMEQIERAKINSLVRQQIASMTTFLNEKTENKQQQTFIAEKFIQIITTLLLTGKGVKSSLRGRP